MSHKEKRHHLTAHQMIQSKYNRAQLPGSLKKGVKSPGQGNDKSKGAIGQKRFEQIGQLVDGGQERKG